MAVLVIGGERVQASWEYHAFILGNRVDELKPHFIPGKSEPCNLRRGKITAVSSNGRSAEISCECGEKLHEAV